MSKKGVVIDYDFTVAGGAELLFTTAGKFLKKLDGIGFDSAVEAKYFAGNPYQAGLAALFAMVKTKKTPQKAARDLPAAFKTALNEAVPAAIGAAFKNFVNAVTDKGVAVVISTRANVNAVKPAFDQAFGERVVLHEELSDCYGAMRWDSWRRACITGKLRHTSTLAVTGAGAGVKSALVAGMGSMAVVNERVAYQDFGGASAVVDQLSGKTARKALQILRIPV